MSILIAAGYAFLIFMWVLLCLYIIYLFVGNGLGHILTSIIMVPIAVLVFVWFILAIPDSFPRWLYAIISVIGLFATIIICIAPIAIGGSANR